MFDLLDYWLVRLEGVILNMSLWADLCKTPAQVGAAQAADTQVGAAQIGTAQVNAAQKHIAHCVNPRKRIKL